MHYGHCDLFNGSVKSLYFLNDRTKKLLRVKHAIYFPSHMVYIINLFNLVMSPHFKGKTIRFWALEPTLHETMKDCSCQLMAFIAQRNKNHPIILNT